MGLTKKRHYGRYTLAEKCIGVELTDNAKLAWSMRPITFSKSEAQQLVGMLSEATNKT